MISCEVFRRRVDSLVDGEVDPAYQVELDTHVESCETCAQLFAFVSSVKTMVQDAHPETAAPNTLQLRIQAALDVEDNRASLDTPVPVWSRVARSRWVMVPAAAAMLLVVWSGNRFAESRTELPEATRASTALSATDETFFDDVLARHARDYPMEVAGPEPQVANWFRGKLEFPVRPIQFETANASLVGGRLSNVREHEAATLYYDVGGRRVTVVVFERPSDAQQQMRARQRGGVTYGRAHGHTVPLVEHEGLTYAIAGDLDSSALLQLAASARVSP